MDDDEIEASWVGYNAAKPSTWTVYFATKAHRLGRVSMQFDAERYAAQADQSTPLAGQIVESWIRPLDTAVKLQLNKVGPIATKAAQSLRDNNDWFPVGEVGLTFAGGDTATLAFDQARMTQAEEKKRSDKLLSAIRGAIGF